MIDVPRSDSYNKIFTGVSSGDGPCCICGKNIRAAKRFVHIHNGGESLVTEVEAATMDEAADLGLQPIGEDCIRKHPEVKPYLQ
jgi:hypothetical protein